MQLDLNLDTVIKDNRKCFYKNTIARKGGLRKNLHFLLDVRGNIMTKDEEKVLNAFFASVCNSETSCSPGTSPLNWKTGLGNRMKPP